MNDYNTFRKQILSEPSVHDFVKETLLELDEYDVVDALNGLDLIKEYLEMKFKKTLETYD
jgi:hypothetical protein